MLVRVHLYLSNCINGSISVCRFDTVDNMDNKYSDLVQKGEIIMLANMGELPATTSLREKFPRGSVAYYIDGKYGSNYGQVLTDLYPISFGLVDEHYPSSVVLRKICPVDTRRFDGKQLIDIPTISEWRRIPKDWTWNTKLDYEVTNVSAHEVDITNPDDIIQAYNDGLMIDVREYDCARIDVEFGDGDNKGLYRIRKKYDKLPMDYIDIPWYKIFATYEEAKEEHDKLVDEFNRVRNLSDLDWSIEQIDNALDRWASVYDIGQETKDKVRSFLMEKDDLEDLCVRVFDGTIQWKYDRNTRWNTINPELLDC